MIQPVQWESLRYLRKSDFQYPDRLDWSVVQALDLLATRLSTKPVIISDYRPNDPKWHGQGRAIDTSWPDCNPRKVLTELVGSRLFTGYGWYFNEHNVMSFHTDTRSDRTPDDPATWGKILSGNDGTRDDAEIAFATVWNLLPPAGNAAVIALAFVGAIWWAASQYT